MCFHSEILPGLISANDREIQIAIARNFPMETLLITTNTNGVYLWVLNKPQKFAKSFLYFCVSFSATAVLFDWIKFDVWNQVVLVSHCSQASLARQ